MLLLPRLLSWLVLLSCIFFIQALPTSLVEDVKDNEIRSIKVKRAHDDVSRPEENSRDSVAYYGNPTAIKRGTKLGNDQLSSWDQDQNVFQTSDVPIIPSSLYTTDSDQFDDKSIAEYEKGYRYGTNKDKLDEALQNAVLKSELYGDPTNINQYRYYGGVGEDNRRRRRNAQRMRLENRFKRDVELSPEDILTILTLWETEHQRSPNFRNRQRFETPLDLDKDRDEGGFLDLNGQDEENWLDTPVYPHVSTHANSIPPNFYYDKPVFDKHAQWGGVVDPKKKKFMVARKRSDPTRELRYINGPSMNDYYTLSQLLGAQRDPNVPVFHRRVL